MLVFLKVLLLAFSIMPAVLSWGKQWISVSTKHGPWVKQNNAEQISNLAAVETFCERYKKKYFLMMATYLNGSIWSEN